MWGYWLKIATESCKCELGIFMRENIKNLSVN